MQLVQRERVSSLDPARICVEGGIHGALGVLRSRRTQSKVSVATAR